MTELLQKTSNAPLSEGNDRPRRVCFVCTGNTCRSPMAEAVANAMAQEWKNNLPEAVRDAVAPTLEAYSAGLYAVAGDPIAQNAVTALERAGVAPIPSRDYHRHTAHTLTAEEAEGYDLLIGLGGGHTMELMMRFPQLANRITCMPKPIADPFGGDEATYEACLAEIVAGVRDLLFAGDAQ